METTTTTIPDDVKFMILDAETLQVKIENLERHRREILNDVANERCPFKVGQKIHIRRRVHGHLVWHITKVRAPQNPTQGNYWEIECVGDKDGKPFPIKFAGVTQAEYEGGVGIEVIE